MTSSNKTLLCLILSLCSFLSVVGKETVFYKFVPGKSAVKATGGQFITFIGDQCFDSNDVGVSVYNGKLKKNVYQSTSEKIVYSGTSFFGTNSKYIFTNNKKNLCIVAPDGKTYQYVESVAPKGQKTCSLIKTNSMPNDNYVDTYNPQNHSTQPSNNYPSSTTNQGTSSNQKSSTGGNVVQRKKCPYCKNGRVTHEPTAPGGFGVQTKPRKRCSECGEWYDPNLYLHYHTQCTHCRGTGYLK